MSQINERRTLIRSPSVGTQDQGQDGTCYAHVFARVARRLLTQYVVELREDTQRVLDINEQRTMSEFMTRNPEDVNQAFRNIMAAHHYVEHPPNSRNYLPTAEVTPEIVCRIKNALIYLFFYSSALTWAVIKHGKIIGGHVNLPLLKDFLNELGSQRVLNIQKASRESNFPINPIWIMPDGSVYPFISEILDLFKRNAKTLSGENVVFNDLSPTRVNSQNANDNIFDTNSFLRLQSVIEEGFYASISVGNISIAGVANPINIFHAMTIINCSKGNEQPRWIDIKNSWGINWPTPMSGGVIRVHQGAFSWVDQQNGELNHALFFDALVPRVDFAKAPQNNSRIETYLPISDAEITDGRGHPLHVTMSERWFCDGVHENGGCKSGNDRITFLNCNSWHSGNQFHRQNGGYDLCMLCATRESPLPNTYQSIYHVNQGQGHTVTQGVYRKWNEQLRRAEVPLCSMGSRCRTNNRGGPLYGDTWGYTWHCISCEFNLCAFCVYYEMVERKGTRAPQPRAQIQETPFQNQRQNNFQIGDIVLFDDQTTGTKSGKIEEVFDNGRYRIDIGPGALFRHVFADAMSNNIRLYETEQSTGSQMDVSEDEDQDEEYEEDEEDEEDEEYEEDEHQDEEDEEYENMWLDMPQLLELGDEVRFYNEDGDVIEGTIERFSTRRGNIMVIDNNTGDEFVLTGNENGLQVHRMTPLEVGDHVAFISGRNNRIEGVIYNVNEDATYVVWYGRGQGQYSVPLRESELELIQRGRRRGGKPKKTRKHNVKTSKRKTIRNKRVKNL
jgi:hypothetical protein